MLLKIIKILTIVISSLCIVAGIVLAILGFLDKPMDTDCFWIAGGIFLIYGLILTLLYFSHKRKYYPGVWVSFVLSLLPIIATSIFLYVAIGVADKLDK